MEITKATIIATVLTLLFFLVGGLDAGLVFIIAYLLSAHFTEWRDEVVWTVGGKDCEDCENCADEEDAEMAEK